MRNRRGNASEYFRCEINEELLRNRYGIAMKSLQNLFAAKPLQNLLAAESLRYRCEIAAKSFRCGITEESLQNQYRIALESPRNPPGSATESLQNHFAAELLRKRCGTTERSLRYGIAAESFRCEMFSMRTCCGIFVASKLLRNRYRIATESLQNRYMIAADFFSVQNRCGIAAESLQNRCEIVAKSLRC
jgi:hypothetical protein